MKNFFTYLGACRNGKTGYQVEFPMVPEREKPVIPESAQGNESAIKFFAGDVYGEKINTDESQFSYKAIFAAAKECTEEELANVIEKGLSELGYPCTDLTVRKVSNRAKPGERQEFEITIMTV